MFRLSQKINQSIYKIPSDNIVVIFLYKNLIQFYLLYIYIYLIPSSTSSLVVWLRLSRNNRHAYEVPGMLEHLWETHVAEVFQNWQDLQSCYRLWFVEMKRDDERVQMAICLSYFTRLVKCAIFYLFLRKI